MIVEVVYMLIYIYILELNARAKARASRSSESPNLLRFGVCMKAKGRKRHCKIIRCSTALFVNAERPQPSQIPVPIRQLLGFQGLDVLTEQ